MTDASKPTGSVLAAMTSAELDDAADWFEAEAENLEMYYPDDEDDLRLLRSAAEALRRAARAQDK